MSINYNHLRYFWFVAHEGKLNKAAEELNISQSALSVQIKILESQLGHQLFLRQGRQLILSEAGRLVLDYADSIFKTGEELLHQLTHNHAVERNVFRVGAITTLSRNFQIGFLRPLMGRPEIELKVLSGSLGYLLQSLENHSIDIALTNHAPIRDSSAPWVSHLISHQPVSLVGDPEKQYQTRELKNLLEEEPLLLPSMESNIRMSINALMDRWDVHPTIAAEINDMTMLRLMAREKTALAVVPPIVVKDELESGSLEEIYRLPDIRETFYAIVPRRRFPNPLVKELVSAG
ncbi:LysR family transcriptional regulator [Salinispira pacifica]|uniref:Transcriptional regulator, LysR family n=1 Tax=Salinispira pacifica TaxID=1307761 RepID=V5WGH2_9SPIO|nr:LysR family transcriptional regulator [Salinispira pacifica]AHC14932.1 Transcriptional regulator, LysR family [Salinispira pacifica]